ncbi:MAG: 3-deoxy-D-manno-octulosonic acid transferase, partial [Candidatus Omnitrophica bacterium]|nr:3-deoxy-D-manno-octulosonic acid transferase [Candidatus Omnitrophota bacterium]
YNLSFIIFGIVYLPYLVVTKRYRHGLLERLGILPERIKSLSSKGKIIWIHAVSMGEMKAASILAPLLRKTFPRHTILFSSVTYTGNKIARIIATGEEGVFYLPYDVSFIVNRVIETIKPELFLCLETELWPNLISLLHGSGAKMVLVNGRISNKSYFGYRKIKFTVSGILQKFSLILMQSEQDAARILSLGAPKEKVRVTGNLKFDLSLLGSMAGRKELRGKLGLQDSDILLVAGSTHRGEDELILESYSRLIKEYRNLRFLIAPRHVERTQEIEQLLIKHGFKPARFSSLQPLAHAPYPNEVSGSGFSPCPVPERSEWFGVQPVFILDTIGNLKTIYTAADIVFIGGSLVKKGGQNPIEPASLGRAVVIGKFTFNFQDVVKSFLEDQACIQVGDKEELCSAIRLLIIDPQERKRLGLNAKAVVENNSGSSQRTIELIKSLF